MSPKLRPNKGQKWTDRDNFEVVVDRVQKDRVTFTETCLLIVRTWKISTFMRTFKRVP